MESKLDNPASEGILGMDNLSEMIHERAAESPSAAAILGLDRPALTYAQLADQMKQVVERLNRMGIGRSDRVAIVLPNGPDLALAFLTIAAGATSAPLNPGYSPAEFDFYLTDLEARALVLLAGDNSPARQIAQTKGIKIVDLIPGADGRASGFDLVGEIGSTPQSPGYARAEDEALVLHTSGTTSSPKMVPLTQANICASARHIVHTLQLTPQDRCLNVMPLFHIHGLMAVVLASVWAGASAVYPPGFDADKFFDWMQQFRPSWYSAVPTIHQAILARVDQNRKIIQDHPLRFIRSSSASLPPRVMADLEQVFAAPVIEAYGMTEAAHQMASNPLPPQKRKPGSVGIQAGPEIAIMDGEGRFLAGEEIGEIVIRGSNVTKGYAQNPEANRSSFSDGWFRTGDQGSIDREGYLFITGRIKEMINRGGEKVTPREVDEVLLDHPAVAQAVTFALPHKTLGEDVATAVVLKPGASISPRELREFALERLSPVKAPSQVILLEQIPKGPTGKLQRIGLAEKLSAYLRTEFRPAESEIERVLVTLWEEILSYEPIGLDDNFFACGGDSLQASRLIARIQSSFEVDLPLGSIFRNPTIRELSDLIENLIMDEIEAMDDQTSTSPGT
jgi:acyl-CoA synthetase (AMP-forming)/AMP-acid ligase II/acyl carrier protein